jgi:hypothetical protein
MSSLAKERKSGAVAESDDNTHGPVSLGMGSNWRDAALRRFAIRLIIALEPWALQPRLQWITQFFFYLPLAPAFFVFLVVTLSRLISKSAMK